MWLADGHGIETDRRHWKKADAAATLHARGLLGRDFSDLLKDLNQGRKDYWYDGEELDVDVVEDLLSDVEELVVAAEGLR